MDEPPPPPPPLNEPPKLISSGDYTRSATTSSSRPGGGGLKGALGTIGGVLLLLFTKGKVVIFALLKFFPVLLKTGGTMLLSIWVYTMMWGWKFAAGFVILIFVHECGHLVLAKIFKLKVGAPVFIPFMGAAIALKEAPKDAWMEAWVGIGGPIFGALGSAVCLGIYPLTGNPLWLALAYSGFFLNLFNLLPIGMLDGGRIVTALSPWLWIVGLVILGWMIYVSPNFLLILILILSVPRLFSLFRKKTDAEKRFFEVSPGRRLIMGILYFGLAAALVVGMEYSHVTVR